LNSQIATLKAEVKAASAAATEKESEISRLSGEVAGFQSQLTSMTEELERAQQAKS
jgi:predicted  nucleic acid-binding Zn-ribbon protein